MKVYTYSQARQRLSTLLDEARKEGEVRIRRRDGAEFVVSPVQSAGSPLDVESADLGWTPESFSTDYSVGLRITVTRVRSWSVEKLDVDEIG